MVIKRNGNKVKFDENRIKVAVKSAMLETDLGVNEDLIVEITDKVYDRYEEYNASYFVTVEEIQDWVEEFLMDSNRKDVAKKYILYREEKNKARNINITTGLLSEDFLSKYKHLPNPMSPLGEFVYYRTYSRWIPELKRREFWWETCLRTIEFNCSLVPNVSIQEAEELFDHMFNLKLFPSGRQMFIGGTKSSIENGQSNFNCAGIVMDNILKYKDLFIVLMLGAGCGIRVLKSDIDKLPMVFTNKKIIHEPYKGLQKHQRKELTSIEFIKNLAIITVGDSRNGWGLALEWYLKIISEKSYKDIDTIMFNYDSVRPKGEKLLTFGGRASGSETLKNMFHKIHTLITKEGLKQNLDLIKLRPLNCLDIANIIGENVVSGSVRRTSLVGLIDESDKEIIESKSGLYYQDENGQWQENTEISHRKMSNNSIYYTKKPTREQLNWQIKTMRYSGEPAFINAEKGEKIREDFELVNPCFTGDMELLTADGYKSFLELSTLKDFNIINYNNNITKGKVWSNGIKDVFKVTLNNGEFIKCTQDHIFMLNDGSECKAIDLVGKSVMVKFNKDIYIHNDLYIKLGFIQGDGNLNRLNSVEHKGIEINIGQNDDDILKLFKFNRDENPSKRSFYTTNYTDKLIELGFDGNKLPDRVFPITYTQWDKVSKASFLKGCYSANGSIITNHRIGYKTTSKIFALQLIKTLKNDFNIDSYLTTNKAKKVKFSNGEYLCKESYDINIGRYDSVIIFYKNIGFYHNYKNQALEQLLIKKLNHQYKANRIEYVGKEEVFDFNEPETHWGIVNNVVVHNCCEIALSDSGMCNLTSNNAMAYVENGVLNIDKFLNAQRLSARMGIRNTCIDFEMHDWDLVQKRDRLIGCSIMGWQDMLNATNMSKEGYEQVWRKARDIVIKEANAYADELGIPKPLLHTTYKPDGSIAQLPTVSSGIHYSHSPYYIRRVRISADDPIVKVCEELGYPVTAENGQDLETCNTKVVAFPVKSPEGKTKYDVTALEQLENYKSSMKNYTTHNTSITVHVRDNEWQDVEDWMYENWDDVLGISFLSLDDNFYPQAPYESITKEEYEKRKAEMKPFRPSLISKYEVEEVELDVGQSECTNGICPIR